MRALRSAGMAVAVLPLLAMTVTPIATAAGTVFTHGPLVGLSAQDASSVHYSSNWSGYAASGGKFSSVSASWVEPTGTCSAKKAYSAFWVGLDGYSDATVEQIGSEVDCRSGSPAYYAWFEMYPAAPVNFSNPVAPGDHFTASVTASGTTFTLTISDATEGWTQTKVKSLASAKTSSAEVIAEAPCCTASGAVLPLADFGAVDFTGAEVDGSPIGDVTPVRIDMGTKTSPIDVTSALSGGDDFVVTWKKL